MNRNIRLFAVVVIISAVVAGRSRSQETKRDPKVQAVIDQMIAAYKGLTTFHEKLVLVSTSTSPDVLKTWAGPTSVEIKFQKPNKVWVDYRGVAAGKSRHNMLVCDGISLWRWQEGEKTYNKSKALAGLLEITKQLPDDSPEMDVLFRGKDPFKDFKMGAAEVPLTLGAAAKVGDIDTDSIEAKMVGEGSPFQGLFRLRIGQKDRLIRELTFEGGGKDPITSKDLTFKFQMTYPIIEAAPVFTPADFTFVPPPGVRPAGANPPTNNPTAPAPKKRRGK